jgi:hypothetical protein
MAMDMAMDDAMDDGFTWLYHPDIDGHFRCPDGAVKAWVGRGWTVAEQPPPEDDKTRDEPMRAALRQALAAEQAPAEAENPTPARSSRTPRAAATEVKE